MKKIVIISICLCGFLVGNAQQKWSLQDCIEYAQEHNIEIKQQALDVKGSEIDLNTSKNERLPDLNGSVDYGFNMGRTSFTDTLKVQRYVDSKSTSGGIGVSSSMTLFSGFRIANNIKVKELNLKAATENLNKAKDNISLQIASLYLEALFNKELLKVYQEQVGLTSSQVEKTDVLVKAGKSPASQLYDIKAQLANDEMNVTNGKNSLDLSLLNLAQALNLTDYESFDIVEPTIDNNVFKNTMASLVKPSELYQTAIAIKPHVKEAQYKLEGSQKNLKVAQSGYWPTLSLGLGYSTDFSHFYGREFDNEGIGRQLSNRGKQYVSLSLKIPIFDRFVTRNQVRQARLTIQNNELALDNVKLNLYKEIQQAYQNATSAQSKYQSAEKAFEAAEESFKYAKDRYEVGKISVYEYSEAQLKILKSRSEQLQAKYDFVFRAKILDFYAGKQINI